MKSRTAFTLIELLITIAVIAILTSVATVSYSTVQSRSRDAQRQNDLNQYKIALSTYYNVQVPSQYPAASTTITINGSTDALSVALEPNYIKEAPLDPRNTSPYLYKYQSLNTHKDFKLYGTLENKNNTKGWDGGSAWVVDGYVLQNE